MRRSLAILGLIVTAATPASAQLVGPRRSITARRAQRAPSIDGELDDAAWSSARFTSDFRQLQPVENATPSQRTEIAFAFDDKALYIAARMFIAGPNDVEAVMTRRDNTGGAERIIVSLDTFHDRRTAYSFAVTAAGVRADWLHTDDSAFSRDRSYDPVWTAAVARHADAWTAEMRIPFSQLRFSKSKNAQELVWGVNINRFIPNKNEDIFWVVVPKGETGWSSYFGDLHGIRGIPPSRRIELLPFAAGDMAVTSKSLLDSNDPFTSDLGFSGRAGLDAKMGIGPNLTLDATVNPDFGQVEADPAVVNLSAFETRFAERRPFFVEGSQLLTNPGPNFYYSRRIGAPPRGSADTAFVDRPAATRILGAAKLTGRLPSRLSIGALSALTQRISADTFDSATNERGRVTLEPLASYNVLRLEQEFGEYSSRVGATLTGVYRNFNRTSPLASQFTHYATSGGADWSLRFAEARYEITGTVGFSAIGGEPEAIAAIQRNSAHYYQRPDQDHVEVDDSATSMNGWTAILRAAKRSGAWRWFAGTFAESPGLDLNDAGILFSGDDIGAFAGGSYRDTQPGRYLHSWEINQRTTQEWNFGGARDPAVSGIGGAITFTNFWRLSASFNQGIPGESDSLTRGGPLTGIGWNSSGSASLTNSFSARTRWSLNLGWSAGHTTTSGIVARGNLTLRPVDRILLSLSPRFVRQSMHRQYIDTIARTDANGATSGNRYIFARFDQRELALQTRLQLAVTPDLFIELYAEPFASSGSFSRFGELPSAGSRTLRRYGTDGTQITKADGTYAVSDGADSASFSDPDFTFLSLRSTLVLRWEFIPGSTLFLVWQQDRSESRTVANAALSTLGDSFSVPGRNVLAIKVAYWWPAS